MYTTCVNAKWLKTDGTSLRGYISTTRRELEKKFGRPMPGDGYKTKYEWKFLLVDENDVEHRVTIYDWKNDQADIPLDMPYRWNIGGDAKDTEAMVNKYFVENGGELVDAVNRGTEGWVKCRVCSMLFPAELFPQDGIAPIHGDGKTGKCAGSQKRW